MVDQNVGLGRVGVDLELGVSWDLGCAAGRWHGRGHVGGGGRDSCWRCAGLGGGWHRRGGILRSECRGGLLLLLLIERDLELADLPFHLGAVGRVRRLA